MCMLGGKTHSKNIIGYSSSILIRPNNFAHPIAHLVVYVHCHMLLTLPPIIINIVFCMHGHACLHMQYTQPKQNPSTSCIMHVCKVLYYGHAYSYASTPSCWWCAQTVKRTSPTTWVVVSREEVEVTDKLLGSGRWAEVKIAKFHGLWVAAKCLHRVILCAETTIFYSLHEKWKSQPSFATQTVFYS